MADRKQEFLARMNAELDAIDAQLDEFRANYRDGTEAARTHGGLETLEQRRDAIRRRSRELEDLDGDDWDAARLEIENARNDLRRTLEESRNSPRH